MGNTGAEIFRLLRPELSPVAAAGVEGNLQQESGLDPNAQGGFLDQGQGSRAHGGTVGQQINALLGELRGPERGTLNALRGARTPQEAALIFSQRFERPGIPDNANRERYAAEALRRYGGLGGVQAPAGGAEAGGAHAGETPAQQADLVSLMSQLAERHASTSPAGLAVGTAAPGQLAPVREIAGSSGPSQQSLLALVSKIGSDASSGPAAVSNQDSTATRAAAAGAASGVPGEGAVAFGVKSLGKYAESEGSNLGPELNKLEKTFGLTGEPWCAIFATTAAAQGGAPTSSRTASVAAINQWASEGSHGYQKGLLSSARAQPGDLLTFGDEHVALVKSVSHGVIHTIEGNADGSGGVIESEHQVGEGHVARPVYRR